MTDLDSTVWRPTSGNGEAFQSDDAVITTQDDFILITQDGLQLQIQPAAYTKLAPTDWVESEGE
jgi:hypothetical protein